LTTQYLYETPNLAASCISGALSQAGRPFAHGFDLYFDRATISFEFANLGGEGHMAIPLSVILPDGRVERPELGSGDPIEGFVLELADATRAIESGIETPRLAGEIAQQALKICLAEIESVKTGSSVKLS
jgi:predicted dehydrogenase